LYTLKAKINDELLLFEPLLLLIELIFEQLIVMHTALVKIAYMQDFLVISSDDQSLVGVVFFFPL